MAEQLQSFIDRVVGIADKRNLAEENPITIRVDVGDGDRYYVVVSYLEPNHVTLPLNVTWIVVDPESAHYMKALRRASALPFDGYRNTWAELRTYQDFLDEPQFWDLSATFQFGEIEVPGVREATVERRGLFKLVSEAADPQDPVVVGDNDERMSNARQPLPHTHPLQPSTMLAGSTGINEFFVTISDGMSPQAGQILALTEEGDEENEWMGIWRFPTAADIVYDGPTFDALVISGTADGTVEEGVPVPFTAEAQFSDGSTIASVPATWEIIANAAAGTISTSTGVFTSNDVVGDQLVRVRATWTHPDSGVQRSETYELNVIDTTVTAVLESITIEGVDTLDEGGNTTAFTITAHYNDGSTAGVNPSTFTSSNPAAGNLNSETGVFTSTVDATNNQITTLTATYSENGVTKSDTFDLTVVDNTVYPQSAEIQGPASVAENTDTTFVLVVTFTDLTTSQVTVSDWAIDNAAAGAIDASSGVLTTPTNLDEDVQAIISASYTSNGRTVTASKNITATDETVYPETASIIGSTQVNEGATTTYQMEIAFSDGTTSIVAVDNWTSDAPGVGVINASTGEFTANTDVTANSVVNISASYTQSGVTVGDSIEVTVVDTTNYPQSAQIVGSSSMEENDSQTLVFRVTYQDGSTNDVTAVWTSSDESVATVDSSGVVDAATNLVGNGSTVITASYSENGVDLQETLTLTVQDVTVYPTSARVIGPETVSENTTVSYQLEVTYDDGSKVIEPVNTFTLSEPSAGTLTSTGSLTAPANVSSNIAAQISATYELDGTTVTGTLNITVTDNTVYPASARIIGPTSVDEETTQTYEFEVTFTDATVQTVAVTDWASSDTSAATINANTGLLTALSQPADATTTISASYTDQGTTVSATLDLTIVDTTNYPVSAEIIGAASVDEGASQQYTLSVTFKDGTTQTMPSTNWASSNTNAGVINVTSGMFQAAGNVTQDTNTTISASYEAYGRTVSDTLVVTVVDQTAYPVSAEVLGPDTVVENSSATYTLRVTFDDGTSSNVAATDWSSTNPAAGTIDAATGEFSSADNTTQSNITTEISASWDVDGTVVTGTKTIGVSDTDIYPQSAEIQGPITVGENGTASYAMVVTYTDNSTATVNPTDWAIDNATAGAINATTGEFTAAADIVGDKAVVVTASYTENGTTVGDSLNITVTDDILRPAGLTVNGPATVNEGETQQFTLTVAYDDGTSATVNASDWSIDNANAGSINATTGMFTPANVSQDEAATISVSYTENGETVTAQFDVTVKYVRVPTSAAILGATTLTEGQSVSYDLEVTFDNATTEIVTVSDWAVDNAAAGTIDANGTFNAAGNVTQDETATISASYSEAGATVNGTASITVSNTANIPVSAQIIGLSTVEEGNTHTYQFEVTYEDGTTQNETISDWASSAPAAGSINASTGLFTAAADVTADTATTISGSFTAHGSTVSATKDITVIDTLPAGAGLARWGYGEYAGPGLDENGHSGPQAFIETLTTIMPSNDSGEEVAYLLPDDTTYAYFAHPKSLGEAVFTDVNSQFAGAWDGASWKDDLSNTGNTGPIEVTFDDGTGPKQWYVYRTDWPGPNSSTQTFRVDYTG